MNHFAESIRAASTRSPIAIVGIGCRFPGGINGPDSFWRALLDGVDAIEEIPASRIDIERYYNARPASPGKISTRWGGFLKDIDAMDADFFGISPREAERMDPQQRLLLEVAWEALEDAGQNLDSLDRTSAGVFIGMWLNDFEGRLFADPAAADFHMTTGSGRYAASGRLSYFLGLQGPSLTVDTACSSSLVAVHLGCRSIWSGECSIALVGGANVILQPHISIAYSQSKMMAPDGRCKFGDASGNGYVRSEGAGIVVLKPLADALRNGDSIYAVIQGSAVNNDGSSSGYLTTPAREGQEDLLRKAYRDAGISPGRVQYVEAHGTGTVAGDPVEIGAMGTVLSENRTPGSVCYVGSVKTNFGHTEGAAGVAGLIKTALMLRHRTIPASLHLREPNPAIPWKDYPVEIPRNLLPWPSGSESAVAGVSAFGIAGTNAHVVLTEAPSNPASLKGSQTDSAYVLPISARSPEALTALAREFVSMLREDHSPSLPDLAFSAAMRRNHHEYRLAAVSNTRQDMSELLSAFVRGESVPGIWTGRADSRESKKVVFVCPGQGSQWLGMGRQLLRDEPVFLEAVQQCEQAMHPFVNWSLQEQLALSPESPKYLLDDIDVIQPSLASIEIALGALWRSWGVIPDAVVGHSMGEVAAAFISGSLNLSDAMRVICERSRLLRTVRGNGAMAVVALPFEEAVKSVAGFRDRVAAAVSNSPRSTVLSGDPASIATILEGLQARNIFCRLVKVDVASHSPQMDALKGGLRQALDSIEPTEEEVPLYSTVTGGRIRGPELSPEYWAQNLRSPVLFSTAVQALMGDGHTTFIELSPHPILLPSIEENVHETKQNGHAVPSLEREKDERATMLASFGRLYTIGFPVDWSRQFPSGARHVPLPSYPWQRRHFWLETKPQTGVGLDSRFIQASPEHPLLGVQLPQIAGLANTTVWQTTLGGEFRNRLRKEFGEASGPLSNPGYLEIASQAAHELFDENLLAVQDFEVLQPLDLAEDFETKIQSIITRTNPNQASFQIFSRAPGGPDEWRLRASMKVKSSDAEAGWIYQTDWKQKSLAQNAPPTITDRPGRWLIFADDAGVGAALAKALQVRGEDSVLAFEGESFQSKAPDRFYASPKNRDDIKRLLAEIGTSVREYRGVIYLWPLNSTNSIDDSCAFSCDGALHLIQALNQLKLNTAPRIWFVTQGAQSLDDGEATSLSLQQSPLWGLGRVIALEQPELFGGLIDLPISEAGGLAESVEMLCGELLTSDGEDQVLLRAQSRYVLRLMRSRAASLNKTAVTIRPDSTYVVTGGIGGLGLQLAAWLVDQGARHIVLTSRTGLPDRSTWNSVSQDSELGLRITAVKQLENAGAEVLVAKADVADVSEMARLWKELQAQHPPVRGIVHAAGVANPRSLLETTAAEMRDVLRSKVDGAWLLHKLTSQSDVQLDFFVMFSSAAALFGAQDLGAYAAANYFMDALSAHRAATALPSLCVNWGWWDSQGLVSDTMAEMFRRGGLRPMPPHRALAALSHLLDIGATQAMVADLDWNVFRPMFEARRKRPLLELIPEIPQMKVQNQLGEPSDEAHSGLMQQIQKASATEQKDVLQKYIRGQVAEILGYKDPEAVNQDLGFFRMGMDSMMTVQLRTRLDGSLKCSLPPTVAFEYPTVRSLSDFVANTVLKLNSAIATIPAIPAPGSMEPIAAEAEHDGLSEDQLIELLEKKLEQIQ